MWLEMWVARQCTLFPFASSLVIIALLCLGAKRRKLAFLSLPALTHAFTPSRTPHTLQALLKKLLVVIVGFACQPAPLA